jgi:hypothetical protein
MHETEFSESPVNLILFMIRIKNVSFYINIVRLD